MLLRSGSAAWTRSLALGALIADDIPILVSIFDFLFSVFDFLTF